MKSILSITVIAICVGMYFMYIRPLTVEIKMKIIEKSGYTKVLSRVKEIKEKREAVLAEYNSISEEEIDRLNKIMPEKIDSVALLNNLSVLGDRYGVVIKDYKIIEADRANQDVTGLSNNGGYKTTLVTINVEGTYEQFLNFLEDLEYSLSLMDVITLNIAPGVYLKDGKASVMNFALEANTYSLR